ncbi:MAG: hypothetical protein EON55_08125 [Alphaproteobacteria bacterium]|nr:MAG: hypothetical protein EON55_08125 [Alphaproteobacteria bacterium]
MASATASSTSHKRPVHRLRHRDHVASKRGTFANLITASAPATCREFTAGVSSATAVPEPISLSLLDNGLISMGLLRRKARWSLRSDKPSGSQDRS